MDFIKTEYNLEPQKNFYLAIEEYYTEISKNLIPHQLENKIIKNVTEQIYNDYSRFWKQYPKSRKRYSKLRLEDLEHDFIRFMITDFIKETVSNENEYRSYSKILFKMNENEFNEYEKRKYWYETK